MKAPSFPFVIRMPKELHDRIEQMAADDNRSTSAMARLLIERGMTSTPTPITELDTFFPPGPVRALPKRRRAKA